MNLASRGVDVRLVPSRDGRIWLEDLAAAIDGSTRVLTISHVEFATRLPQRPGCAGRALPDRAASPCSSTRSRGSGRYRIDVRRTPIDFLAADGHKWLLGPGGRWAAVSSAATGSSGCGRSASAGTASSARTIAPRSSSGSSPAPSAGKGARSTCPACWPSAPAWACSSRWGSRPSRDGSSTGPRPVRELAAVGGLAGLRLDRDQRTARPSWCSRRDGGRSRGRGRRELRRDTGSSSPAGAGGSASARTSTTMTRTSTGSGRTWRASADPVGQSLILEDQDGSMEPNDEQTPTGRPFSPGRSTRSRSAIST